MYCRCRLGEHLLKCVIRLDVALVENFNFLLLLRQQVSVLFKGLNNLDNSVGSHPNIVVKIKNKSFSVLA